MEKLAQEASSCNQNWSHTYQTVTTYKLNTFHKTPDCDIFLRKISDIFYH